MLFLIFNCKHFFFFRNLTKCATTLFVEQLDDFFFPNIEITVFDLHHRPIVICSVYESSADEKEIDNILGDSLYYFGCWLRM